MKFSQHALVRGLEFQNIFRKSTQKLRRSVVPKSRENVTTTRLFAFLTMVLFVEVYRCAQVNKWIQLLLWTVGERFVTVTPVLYGEKKLLMICFSLVFPIPQLCPSVDRQRTPYVLTNFTLLCRRQLQCWYNLFLPMT